MADQTYLFRELSRNKREELGTGLLPVVELGEIEPLTRECVEIVSWTRRGLAGPPGRPAHRLRHLASGLGESPRRASRAAARDLRPR